MSCCCFCRRALLVLLVLVLLDAAHVCWWILNSLPVSRLGLSGVDGWVVLLLLQSW